MNIEAIQGKCQPLFSPKHERRQQKIYFSYIFEKIRIDISRESADDSPEILSLVFSKKTHKTVYNTAHPPRQLPTSPWAKIYYK